MSKKEEKTENRETVIKITNLVKEYKMFNRKKDRLLETIIPKFERHTTFRAMDNLNLEVKKGEVLGILGKNGAGKSTLLKMITGVVFPTSGEIEIKGRISSLLELGTAFNPELTGYENIYQHGQIFGMTDQEIKAKEQEIIDFADIGEHLSQPVKTYSSGMFARLAFACAINVDPDILIVDEVLSVGDMAFQLKCFKKFEQFKNQGKTILFVTHSISDVIRNCTRTIIIDGGKKIFEGSVKEGTEKYKKLIVGLDINAKSSTKTQEEIEIEKKQKIDRENDLRKEEKKAEDEEKAKEEAIEPKAKNEPKKIKDDSQIGLNQKWKQYFVQNDKMLDYGNKKAEVIDYGIFDVDDHPANSVGNDEEIVLKSKVKFNEDIINPIFTMTVKDFKGLDIAGTNTDFERMYTGEFKKGDTVVAEFRQKLPLSAGKYTLSFSCTLINEKGDLEVLNRKYDALLIEITTTKNTVGLFRLDSKINVIKL